MGALIGSLNPDSAVELTVLYESGVRLQERGHRSPEFHSLFCCLAICYRQVPNTTLRPLLPDRFGAQTYGLRYGGLGLAPCVNFQRRHPGSKSLWQMGKSHPLAFEAGTPCTSRGRPLGGTNLSRTPQKDRPRVAQVTLFIAASGLKTGNAIRATASLQGKRGHAAASHRYSRWQRCPQTFPWGCFIRARGAPPWRARQKTRGCRQSALQR